MVSLYLRSKLNLMWNSCVASGTCNDAGTRQPNNMAASGAGDSSVALPADLETEEWKVCFVHNKMILLATICLVSLTSTLLLLITSHNLNMLKEVTMLRRVVRVQRLYQLAQLYAPQVQVENSQ